MLNTTIDNNQETIDSRDLIDRAYDLIDTYIQAFNEQQKIEDGDEAEELEREDALHNDLFLAWLIAANDDERSELAALIKVWRECENLSDWTHGEQLIRRSYFVDYITQLIDDCYELPKELTSGNWPYRHIRIDYEAAADEAEYDYMTVDFNGVDYLIRCV